MVRLSSSSILLCVLFAGFITARPSGEGIVFRDDDEELSLHDENQILPSDGVKLTPDTDEAIEVRLEHGNFYQGDIKLQQDQKEFLKSNRSIDTRTGWIDESYRWPKDRQGYVNVPYYMSPKSSFSYYQISLFRQAMKDIEKYTCVRFSERKNEEDYLFLYSGKGCSSHLGRIGGQQELSIQKNGCFGKGIIIHELIHALGYDHMHSHSERNKFIEIKWENIDEDALSNFDEVDAEKFSNFGTKYDLYSVMHYDKDAFSKNGEPTIVPRNRRYKNVIGQRVGMSVGDAKRINNMYNCFK